MTHAGTDKRGQLLAKYMFDKLIAATMLLALSPFFLFIAIAIKLDDRGPVFFRQERLGVDGSLFRIWKFRTLIVDADRLLEPDGSVKVDRSTRVGRVLRFLSLDELPQPLNILNGDMSIVGPRPALPEHLQRYTCAQRGRLAMRPGVTGLAQINGRNTLKWSRRIEYDLEYIRTFSLLQDLMILIKTVKVVLLREGVAADRNPEQVDDLASPRR
jgi:lipopolysaccharide/colanic/teichoic acid biosynthesis glycosyltransferase